MFVLVTNLRCQVVDAGLRPDLNGQVFGNNRDRDIEVAQSQNGFLIETGGPHPDESVARAVGFMVKPTGV